MNTVRRVVNALHGLICVVIGHRREQKQGHIAGFAVISPIRCARCDALALRPFHAGSEDYR